MILSCHLLHKLLPDYQDFVLPLEAVNLRVHAGQDHQLLPDINQLWVLPLFLSLIYLSLFSHTQYIYLSFVLFTPYHACFFPLLSLCRAYFLSLSTKARSFAHFY